MSFKLTKKTISDAQKTFRALKKVHKPGFDSIVIPMIRKVMPTLLANDIVGIQPMSDDDIYGTIHGLPITNKQFAQARAEYEKDEENKDS